MATASQFRETATAFDTLAQSSGTARFAIYRVASDTGVRGGTFATTIDRGLDTTTLNLASVMGRCLDEAAEARRRAIVCDVYTAAVQDYDARVNTWQFRDPAGPYVSPPIPPSRPAVWADAG